MYSIDRYLRVQAAYAPTFAANGRSVTFISNITGTAQVWQVDFRHGNELIPWPRQLTFAADRVMALFASPQADDPRLIYAADMGGNENAQLFLLNPKTGLERCLTAGQDKVMHIFGDWSAAGNMIVFASNRRHPGRFDLYRQMLTEDEPTLVWQHEEPGYLFNMRFAPDGQRVVLVRSRSSFAMDLFEIDLARGAARQLNDPHEDARYLSVNYSKDGRSLFLNSDLGSEFTYVAQLELATLSWETVVAPNWDTSMAKLSADGRYLAYVTNKEGRGELALIDRAMSLSRVAPLPDDAPGLVGWHDGTLAFSQQGSQLAFSYTSARQTSNIFVWDFDLQVDSLQQLSDSSHGGIPTHQFIAPERIQYPTFDGRQIPAWFFQPAQQSTTRPMPVVVLVHGGPESQFRPYFNFLAQYLVHQGYAVLGINVRGSTGYGKSYAHLDNVEKRMDSVADLGHAAHWLKAQPQIDSERIAVYGGSYGGFMVLSALTTYPDLWAAGVNIVGISSFVTFLENTSDYRRAHREAEYGSLAKDRDYLERISPINHLEKIEAPLLVIHGANDPRVPVSEARQLVAALEARAVPVELIIFDDEGHGVAKLKNKLVMYPAVVDFLQRYL